MRTKDQRRETQEKMKAATARWVALRDSIADGGYYGNAKAADRYFVKHIEPAWLVALDRVDEDSYLIDELGVTPTMRRIIHFFARAHAGVGRTSATPRLTCWPPFQAPDGSVKFFHAVSRNDLAKMCHASRSATDEALDRIRGKGKAGDRIFDHRLAAVLSVETGVMVDGIFSKQMNLPFMLEVADYEHANEAAFAMRSGVGSSCTKTMTWCREGIAQKSRPIQTSLLEHTGISPAGSAAGDNAAE